MQCVAIVTEHTPLNAVIVVCCSFKSQNGENRNGGVEGGGAVNAAHQQSISLTVIPETHTNNICVIVFLSDLHCVSVVGVAVF